MHDGYRGVNIHAGLPLSGDLSVDPDRRRARLQQRDTDGRLAASGLLMPGMPDYVAYGARGRRETIRQLAELRRRLAAAEHALDGALAAMKQGRGCVRCRQ